MRKQSIKNRKWRESVEAKDPKRFEEMQKQTRFRAAKSYIKLYANDDKLNKLETAINLKRKLLSSDDKDSQNKILEEFKKIK